MEEKKTFFQTFGKRDVKGLFEKASLSPRKRKNYNLHELPDTVQRFLNAMMPFSYVRPHRHLHPPKTETFVLLSGKVWVLLFDNEGNVSDAILMEGKRIQIVDLLPGCWHTLIPITKSLTFEVKPGPYDPATDKEFAPWAPSEEETHLHREFLARWLTMAHHKNRSSFQTDPSSY
ncbi:MAG: WbuC family cupin fold metalloprotein [Brevinematales bacterium]|nr:WbuC family cupin fold metalloprotein [Brevinematales bacterium]